MVRSSGCRVWDDQGREFVDYLMGLGAVALGYGHPEVTSAVTHAVENGVVGPLAPVLEEELATELCHRIPWMEQVRFLKTGAEAMAAAVRLARVATKRECILGCGYHGWLDWCQGGEGVPRSTRALYDELPFNDPAQAREMIRATGDRLAAVVFEPIVVYEPDSEWLEVLREETARCGALLVVDEIKTVCRVAIGGACERYHIRPDLVVVGKALANGFPLAAVGGRSNVMAAVSHTWISSTLATEFVALAAAQATLKVMVEREVPEHLRRVGRRLLNGLTALRHQYPDLLSGVGGVSEMCFLQYTDEAVSREVTAACALAGLLFKRSAYNFVSLAHTDAVVDHSLELIAEALSAVGKPA
ncbi:MAG TPA: aminotransferase class III-fold pyridoxal phosphate-dependent enzyme [Gemmatimonadales bacterium]|jgi:glutamate-1-semialdehyde 2,1-aminomutase|nr:aminotransferase class III-fold pyridoxal phosphate-dependent enzyme [Gemmatimonadales bacterium]